MKARYLFCLMALSVAMMVLAPVCSSAKSNDFHLKKGAQGAVCLTCHVAFRDKLKKKFVHTPLKDGNCTGCHNPHTADHGKLLAANPDKICFTCHDDIVPAEAKSVHQVAAEGKCVECHDPHASNYEKHLLRPGNKLCFGCHQDMEKVGKFKYSHPPVTDSCLECHNPHASKDNPKLLNASSPALCLQCHDPKKKTFKSWHAGYPVEKGDCTSCHNPHGSNTTGMLYDDVHDPVAKRMCSQCHAPPTSAKPFATQRPGYELCQGCHYNMVNDTFNKGLVHWPIVDQKGCLNCHSPHASMTKPLLNGTMLQVCGRCHADTIARQERSQTKHPPIVKGDCADCHSVHSSSNQFMLNKTSVLDVCGKCHQWQTHSTHPIGAKVVDPRNPNLTLDCLSCHRTHGTRFKHFLQFNGDTNDLCTQCHTQFRR